MRAFHLKITLADESTKVFAWCTGQTATELLQISPDEFNELSEVVYSNLMIYVSFLKLIYLMLGMMAEKNHIVVVGYLCFRSLV